MKPRRPSLQTTLCDLLRVEYPVIQSGMGGIAGPELVAEVCRAGGLGILAGLGLPADELRRQIRRVRELTDRPFGVNLWLHRELLPPQKPSDLPVEAIRSVQEVLNRFRARLELPSIVAPPDAFPDVVPDAIEVILAERVPVWSIGLGNPDAQLVERCRRAGTLVMAMVCTVEDGRTVSTSGVDVIVAQGIEAGGHRSLWERPSSQSKGSISTMVLVPQLVDAVPQPVVAAGGIADGRGVVAALALGASGALLGTRFVATKESMALPMFKKALLATTGDETTVTNAFTGLNARALRNRFIEEYSVSGAPVLPSLLQAMAAEDVFIAAAKTGNAEYYPMFAGQSAGLIADLPSASTTIVRNTSAADGKSAINPALWPANIG